MKTCIVLPSYNEKDNILLLIEDILKRDPQYFVCVVDDSSPDGTTEILATAFRERTEWGGRTQLIVRSKKDGRGGAIRDGFAWGYNSNQNFEAFVEMDCDFSHEPQAIATGLKLLEEGADVSLGVRYPDGIIIDWPITRRAFSFFANTLARTLMEGKITDYTNGFRFYKRSIVSLLLSQPQAHRGYIYLSETLSLLLKSGCSIALFPTIFKNRNRGVSNTTLKEIKSALTGIIDISWKYRFGKKLASANGKKAAIRKIKLDLKQ
jgi:dolichol-phosphate mannosyltransferase